MGWNRSGQDFSLLVESRFCITVPSLAGRPGCHGPGFELPALSFLDSAPLSSLRVAFGSAEFPRN